MSTAFTCFFGRSLLAARTPMLEHALGRDQPLAPWTRDELAGDQRGMAPATLSALLACDPRRPDGMRALPAALRDHLWQQLDFTDCTLVVRGLHHQPIFHEAIVASRMVSTQPGRVEDAPVKHLLQLEDARH